MSRSRAKSKRRQIRGKDRPRVVRALIRRDGLACFYCHKLIDLGAAPNSKEWLSIHHVIPRSEGGESRLENLRLAHRGCDNEAGGKRTRPGLNAEEAA